jgi:hypothetical protein
MYQSTYRTGTTRNREMISWELARQLAEVETNHRRAVARIQEIGHDICEHIEYEDYCLWIDGLPDECDTDDRAMIAAHEAKLAELVAEAEAEIEEVSPEVEDDDREAERADDEDNACHWNDWKN